MGQVVERIFRRARMNAPLNVLEAHSLSMALNLLMTSDAIAILPECVVHDRLRAGELVRLPIAMGDPSIELGALTRREDPVNPMAVEFADLLRRFRDRSGHNRLAAPSDAG